MTTEMALRDPAWQAEWAQMIEVAKALANTGYVPDPYRGKPDDVFATVVAGQALGLKPVVALMNCAVINGRPTFEGEVLLGLIRQHGHSVRRTECSAERVVVVGKRADNGDVQEVVWTRERAERAGLAGKATHKTYPELMLTWRAITELARVLFSDVTLGLASYTAEELGADDPEAMGKIVVDTVTGEVVTEAEYVEVPAAEGEPGTAEGVTTGGVPSEGDATSAPPSRPEAEPGSPSAEAEEKKITEAQRRKIRVLLSKLVDADVFSEERFRAGLEAAYGTPHTSKLTRAQATDLIDRLGTLEEALDEETKGEE